MNIWKELSETLLKFGEIILTKTEIITQMPTNVTSTEGAGNLYPPLLTMFVTRSHIWDSKVP